MNEFIKKNQLDSSTYALLIANLVPIFGILFLGWDARDLVFIYWCENVVVGLFAIFRMALAVGPVTVKMFMVPFFCFHFGIFTLVHGVFVSFLVFGSELSSSNNPVGFATGFSLSNISIAILALLLSHGYSFFTNYIYGDERTKTTVDKEMMRPYKRVGVMHFTILISFFLIIPFGAMGESLGILRIIPALILTAVKIISDVKLHQKSHQNTFSD